MYFNIFFLSMYHVQNVETTYTVLWSNVDQKWTYQVTLAKPAPQKNVSFPYLTIYTTQISSSANFVQHKQGNVKSIYDYI
jgi:hypothetical protein